MFSSNKQNWFTVSEEGNVRTTEQWPALTSGNFYTLTLCWKLPTFPPRCIFLICFHRDVDILNVEPYGLVKDAPGSSEAKWFVSTSEVTQHQWKADAGILPCAAASSPATVMGQCTTGAGSKDQQCVTIPVLCTEKQLGSPSQCQLHHK